MEEGRGEKEERRGEQPTGTQKKVRPVEPEVILSKGRQKAHVKARDVFCHRAVDELGVTLTDLARLIGMTPSAISYAVLRGRAIAAGRHTK